MTQSNSSRRNVIRGSLAAAAAGALAAPAVAHAATAATPAAGVTATTPYRVAFQVSDNDPKKWALTLNNARNAQEDLGAANITIEIVVYGPGIDMLKADSEVSARVLETLQAKIAVLACQNTMRGRSLKPQDMIAGVGYVSAGVGELIKRQAEGYAYIRS
jgi:intracellular sulfur oxidation DsrE/DsrF family protein